MNICGLAKFNNRELKNPFHKNEEFFTDSFCCINKGVDCDGLKVLFDGVIYNLEDFKEENLSDCAEIIIAKNYRKYGVESFSKYEGTFAIAIYDFENRQVILARDKIGGKPLYYYFENGEFLFSSKLKDIIDTGIVPKTVDKDALSVYLQLTYVPAPFSMIEKVYKVMPASAVILNGNGEIESVKYWELEINPHNFIKDYSIAKSKLKEEVFKSVERRLKGNVGALLSGGFDSSIVVGVASQISSEKLNAFTIKFSDKYYDESNLARLVIEKNNAIHNVVDFSNYNLLNVIEEVFENMDEPYGDSSIISSYIVSKEAKLKVDAVLSGDGGDELFAGYNRYLVSHYNALFKKVPRFMRNGIIKPCSKIFGAHTYLRRKIDKFLYVAEKDVYEQRKALISLGFKGEELQSLMKNSYVNEMVFVKEIFDKYPMLDSQTKAQLIDFNVVLEGDMMTKAYKTFDMTNLLIKSPLLDKSVIELSYNMPSNFKIKGKDRKIILKDAFKEYLPQELYTAKKHGFGVPMRGWISNELKPLLLKYSSKDFLEKQGLFNYESINAIIEEHTSNRKSRWSELWAFIVFQNWYETIFLKEAK